MSERDSKTRGVLKLRFFHIFSTFPLTTLMTSDFVVESPESNLLAEVGKTGKGCKIPEGYGLQKRDSLTDRNQQFGGRIT